MDVGIFGVGGGKILFMQSRIFFPGNGVVRFVHAAAVGRGVLERHHRAGGYVVEKVLVFSYAGEIVVFRVVDHGMRLEELAIVFTELERDAAVGQIAEAPVHEFVHRAGVENAAVSAFLLYVVPGGVELHGDVPVGEHLFQHGGVAFLRNALPAVLKIAVVAAHVDGHATGDRRIELFRFHAPLLHGVEEKNFLVDVLGKEVEIVVVGLAQFENGDLFIEAETGDELVFEAGGQSFREHLTHGVQIEGDGYELAVYEAHDLVHVRMPFREAGDEIPGGLHVRMKDVRAVLVDADAVSVVIIVAVAPYVRFLVHHECLFAPVGKNPGYGCAGNAGSHDDVLHCCSPFPLKVSVFGACMPMMS